MVDDSDYDDGQLFADVSHAYRTITDACMTQIGLRRAQVLLLMQLYREEGITQTDLAERLSLNAATVSDMLQRMEETHLIVRERDIEDRRLVRVYLTDEGREKQVLIQHQLQTLETKMFQDVPAEHRVFLRHILRQLLHNMGTGIHKTEGCCH